MATYHGKQVKIVVDTAKLELLKAGLAAKGHKLLDKTAFDVEATAKTLAPVDTGALRSSIYTSGASGGGSGYSAAMGDAASRASSRGKQVEFNDEVKPASQWQRIVAPSVVYAIFPEIRGHPYLAPAVEAHRAAFLAAWYEVVK